MAAEKKAKEKPLEKMTAPELREIAKEIAGITGVHAMNKGELVQVIRKARGITGDTQRRPRASLRDIKQKIRRLREVRAEAAAAQDKKMADMYRRRISRLKKKTRRAA